MDAVVGRHEAPLAMRNRDRMHVADLRLQEPGRFHRDDFRMRHARDMTADGVEGEGGALGRRGADLAPRHEAELDDRLEPVADAERESVALVEQRRYRLFQARVAEEGGDELA